MFICWNCTPTQRTIWQTHTKARLYQWPPSIPQKGRWKLNKHHSPITYGAHMHQKRQTRWRKENYYGYETKRKTALHTIRRSLDSRSKNMQRERSHWSHSFNLSAYAKQMRETILPRKSLDTSLLHVWNTQARCWQVPNWMTEQTMVVSRS